MNHVRIDRRPGGLCDLVLQRPKVNALSRATIEEFRQAIATLARDEELRGVFLRTEGRVYSAGLDLKELLELEDESELLRFAEDVEAVFLELYTLPVPVVTAIHGTAIAGGLVMAMCADRIVLSANEMSFGLTELQVGVPFPNAALEITRATLPTALLRRLVFDAELLNAEEAFVLGFGQQRVEDATGAAREWLEKVSARPLEPYRMAKAQLRAPTVARAVQDAERTRLRFARTLIDPDTKNAIRQAL